VDEEIADLASLLAMNIEVRMLATLSLLTLLRLVGSMLHTRRTTRARPMPSSLLSLHSCEPSGETATCAPFNEVPPAPPSTLPCVNTYSLPLQAFTGSAMDAETSLQFAHDLAAGSPLVRGSSAVVGMDLLRHRGSEASVSVLHVRASAMSNASRRSEDCTRTTSMMLSTGVLWIVSGSQRFILPSELTLTRMALTFAHATFSHPNRVRS
jgi:hypothetical protein